jgi:hypothetical protein
MIGGHFSKVPLSLGAVSVITRVQAPPKRPDKTKRPAILKGRPGASIFRLWRLGEYRMNSPFDLRREGASGRSNTGRTNTSSFYCFEGRDNFEDGRKLILKRAFRLRHKSHVWHDFIRRAHERGIAHPVLATVNGEWADGHPMSILGSLDD